MPESQAFLYASGTTRGRTVAGMTASCDGRAIPERAGRQVTRLRKPIRPPARMPVDKKTDADRVGAINRRL
jgi:hypothetical protein